MCLGVILYYASPHTCTHMHTHLYMCCDFSSTDSELRQWDYQSGSTIKQYRGHVNEKNFVGLSINGDYIVCGRYSVWEDVAMFERMLQCVGGCCNV